jgi:hypothetical protein
VVRTTGADDHHRSLGTQNLISGACALLSVSGPARHSSTKIGASAEVAHARAPIRALYGRPAAVQRTHAQ